MLKSNLPTISIVTPSYNQGEYLEETICSVLDQQYANLEYIIIDGGSSDQSVEIIKKYQKHLTYWVSEPDKGQSEALNKGLQKCTGDIFNWINSDDYLERGALHKIAEAFIYNPNALQVCGFCRIFDQNSLDTILLHRSELFSSTEKTIVQEKINQQGSFYKLSVVKELGLLNNTLNCVMDLELWFKFLCKYGQEKIVLIDDLLAHFRMHTHSKTSELEKTFRIEANGLFFELIKQLNSTHPYLKHFSCNRKYQTNLWNKDYLNCEVFYDEVAIQNFFDFYQTRNYLACRRALKSLIKNDKIPFNKHFVRIILKIYLGI
jgi:glycosyltransferase involved in cell wall biosynthesis